MLRSVAIVDDDDLFRSSMAALVRSLGFETQAYVSAEAYLAGAETLSGCVISDIQMPGIDGFELLGRIRRRSSRPPVILMTGQPIPNARERALQAGASDFIEKPVDEKVLLDCLQSILGRNPEI